MSNPSSVFRYRIRNWHEYNRALINRGRLTVWFDEQAIAAWRNTEPAAGPGAPRLYADLAIECALVFKLVYHLSLRAAQGFLASVVELMKLALPIPDYSTVSRRQGVLQVPVSALPQSGPRHVVIDATGLRIYGAGEWRVCKHRFSRRRTGRKPHLGIEERTKEIVAVELPESSVHDSQPLPALLDQIPDPIGQVSGDGAYDTRLPELPCLLRECKNVHVDPSHRSFGRKGLITELLSVVAITHDLESVSRDGIRVNQVRAALDGVERRQILHTGRRRPPKGPPHPAGV